MFNINEKIRTKEKPNKFSEALVNLSYLIAERGKYYSKPLIRNSHIRYVYIYHLFDTRFSLTVRKGKQTSIIIAVKMLHLHICFLFLLPWSITLNIHVFVCYWHFSQTRSAIGIRCSRLWEVQLQSHVFGKWRIEFRPMKFHLQMLIKNYANNWYKNKWKVLKIIFISDSSTITNKNGFRRNSVDAHSCEFRRRYPR